MYIKKLLENIKTDEAARVGLGKLKSTLEGPFGRFVTPLLVSKYSDGNLTEEQAKLILDNWAIINDALEHA